MKLSLAVSMLTLLGASSLAHADAVDGPPACPPGARGRSAHEGQWCVPAICDDGCETGERCEDRRVCTQTASVIPGGLRPTTPPPQPRELVVATCDAASACTGMEEPPPPTVGTLPMVPPTCTTMRVCVPSVLPSLPIVPAGTPGPVPTSPSSCLCSAPGTPSRTPWLALIAMGWIVAAVTRRRR